MIVGVGEMVIEALIAARHLAAHGIECEVIDLVSIYPIDHETVRDSAIKTGRLIVADSDKIPFSVVNDLLCSIGQGISVRPVACEAAPYPLTTGYYLSAGTIVTAARELMPDHEVAAMPDRSFLEVHLPPTFEVDELISLPTESPEKGVQQ
jgi:hypothetical protein